MKATLVCALLAAGSFASPAPAPVPSATQDTHCDAPFIADICDYPSPLKGTAVAAENREGCWRYCHNNTPCDFVIFVEGNPTLGSGSCWVYHGQEYDPSKAKNDGCEHKGFTVYGKPSCDGDSAAATAEGACAATASPSAIAEVCDYPDPPDRCVDSCMAALSASDCLSECAKSDSCNYAIFKPENPGNSQFYDGNCRIYSTGEYDSKKAKTCKGAPELFVYKNTCPKPKPKPTPTPKPNPSDSKGGDSKDGDKNGDKGGSNDNGGSTNDSKDGDSKDGNKNGNSSSGSNSNNGGNGDSGSSTDTKNGDGKDGSKDESKSASNKPSSASVYSFSYALAIGATVLMIQSL